MGKLREVNSYDLGICVLKVCLIERFLNLLMKPFARTRRISGWRPFVFDVRDHMGASVLLVVSEVFAVLVFNQL
jgi:hypothetical protein